MTGPEVILARNAVAADEQPEMQTLPEAGLTPPAREVPARNPKLALAGRIASWLLVAAATAIALGLVAISIGPRFLPYQALVVRSGSMSPTIPTGSVVFYRKVTASNVKVGDVIVFDKPGQQNEKVTHRVFKISNGPTGRYFTTKGDANGAPDDWRVPAVGTGWVANFHVPALGYVLADLQSTTARLLLLVIPALLLGMITLYEIWREREPRGRGA
jgi:signal peptidase I